MEKLLSPLPLSSPAATSPKKSDQKNEIENSTVLVRFGAPFWESDTAPHATPDAQIQKVKVRVIQITSDKKTKIFQLKTNYNSANEPNILSMWLTDPEMFEKIN